jgi:sigma-E factor negative regulatory protein RseB
MKSALRGAVLFLLLGGCSALAVAGDPEQAREWLQRMSQAMQTMSYQGTFVYAHGTTMETMRITHVADENGVRERLYSVTGPKREVVRDNEGVRCVLEDAASVVEDQVVENTFFPELPLSVIEGDESGYRLETGGSARIAGHTAHRISIAPADAYRYGYDFWLEQQTGLLLKWVLLDSNRRQLAKLMFTDFAIGEDVDLREIEPAGEPVESTRMKTLSPEKTVATNSKPRWQPAKLPPGFQLASHNHKAGGQEVYEHLVYSDGLAVVSVYIEEKENAAAIRPHVAWLGTNNAYIHGHGDLQITVIGEVPVVTVKSIGVEMARTVAAD